MFYRTESSPVLKPLASFETSKDFAPWETTVFSHRRSDMFLTTGLVGYLLRAPHPLLFTSHLGKSFTFLDLAISAGQKMAPGRLKYCLLL